MLAIGRQAEYNFSTVAMLALYTFHKGITVIGSSMFSKFCYLVSYNFASVASTT